MLEADRYYFIDTRAGKMLLNPGRDSLQSGLFWSGEHYEKGLDQLIKSVVKPGDTVFDIGAHIGFYTILLSKLVQSNGKCYSFEPQKNLHEMIVKTLDLNDISNTIPFNVPLSDKSGKIKFFQTVDQSHSSVSSIVSESEAVGSSYELDCISLDEFILQNNIEEIRLIKIDAEGAEAMILNGAKNSLNNKIIRNFLIELHEEQLVSLGSSCAEVISCLEEQGFEVFYFDYKTGLTSIGVGWKPSSWHIFAKLRKESRK
jgi:FkbM family methyltransferase